MDAYRDITILPIVVSATSIFSLPEIQLEKEAVRPTVSADPGRASVLIQSSVLLYEWMKIKNLNQFLFPISKQSFQKAESALLISLGRQKWLCDLSTWAETATCILEAECASPDTILEVDSTSAIVPEG